MRGRAWPFRERLGRRDQEGPARRHTGRASSHSPAQLTDGTYPWVLTDLNECEQPSVCQGGRCTNTPGSYHCECAKGYVMGRRGQCKGECANLPYMRGSSPFVQTPALCPPSPTSTALKHPLGKEGRPCHFSHALPLTQACLHLPGGLPTLLQERRALSPCSFPFRLPHSCSPSGSPPQVQLEKEWVSSPSQALRGL